MFFCDYPIKNNEVGLPLFLDNIGKHVCQPRTVRGSGFTHPQILYCTKGNGVLCIDGSRIEIPPNTAFFLPSGYPHEYYPTAEEWDLHWVVPDGYACGDLLTYIGLDKPTVIELKDTALLEHFFSRMHESIRGDSIGGNLRASGYLYNFLIELYRQMNSGRIIRTSNRAIVAAIDHINNCYMNKITMAELCEVTELSKQQLCRLFKRYLNSRPMEYIAKRRIQAAKEMLTSTEMSVEDIADAVGFCSGSYFCKLFSRYEGMTPTQFRNI
ncbi:AraC-type DNA-binding protein [Ruminococcus sp. YE71]|uniref:AraC family transcriptional regulator n=1 Tax=unclassified Ruminococcus TaxID=2608920 RepID=UPI00088FA745|nr:MULTISPECIES: AraC family transcriptional regulator [unclassified Ruminococcus]SDA14365.1 AraC-type DNA-binding protein [Ruminococcus sp. YE78]SFW20931.1 AraC-type DNA-binding protein [Ruminococcus sp. YE71]